MAWRLARGLRPCWADTGAYCTAREDLPEDARLQLVRETGRRVNEEVLVECRRLKRRVFDMALLQSRGVDIVVRKHQLRASYTGLLCNREMLRITEHDSRRSARTVGDSPRLRLRAGQ